MSSSVYEKIITNAKNEAEVIKENGKIKAQNITEQLMNETNQKLSQVILETNKKCENILKTEVASLEQSKAQLILKNKKQIIKNTFNQAHQKLLQMNNDELTKYVINNLNKVNLNGGEFILVNELDYEKYMNLFSSNHNNELDKLFSNKYNLLLKKSSNNISGGFIVESMYYDIDYSYEVVLASLEENLEKEICEMLFGMVE